MGFLQAAVGNIISVVAFCLFVGGVLKLFQIQTTLSEIKDVLTALKARQEYIPPADRVVATGAPSGDEMLRALDRELHLEGSAQAIDPEIVEPRS